MGRRKEADAAWQRARELYSGLAADFPWNPVYRKDLGRVYVNLIGHYRVKGRPKEAEAAFDQCLTIWRDLVTEFPDVPGYRNSLAATLNRRGVLLKNLGQAQEAEEVYKQALAISKQLVADYPREAAYRDVLGDTLGDLGVLLDRPSRSREVVLQSPGRSRKAAGAFTQAVAVFEQLAADFPTEPDYRNSLARNRDQLAGTLRDAGRYPEAEATFH